MAPPPPASRGPKSCASRESPRAAVQGAASRLASADGWELWPTVLWPDCPPVGPNPVGAPCDVTGEAPHGCAEGLVCFYWGDEITACDGGCRTPGTECTVDDDCVGDDVCHLGYCVWCCPG